MAPGARSSALLSVVLVWSAAWQQLLAPARAAQLVAVARQLPQQFLQAAPEAAATTDAAQAGALAPEAFLESGVEKPSRRRTTVSQKVEESAGVPADLPAPDQALQEQATIGDNSGAPSAVTQQVPSYQAAMQKDQAPLAPIMSPSQGEPPSMPLPELKFADAATSAAMAAAAGFSTGDAVPVVTPQASGAMSLPGQHLATGGKNVSIVNSLKNQAEAMRMNRGVMEQYVASLKAQAADAEEELAKAKEKEAVKKSDKEAATARRQEEEVRAAVSTARWTTQMSGLDDQLTSATTKAKKEQEDRLTAEALKKGAEDAKTAQALEAAQAISDDKQAAAFESGAKSQERADKDILEKMSQALKEVSVAAARGAEMQQKLNDLATKAGQTIGSLAKTYQPGSPVAQAVAAALADAAISGEAVKAQEQAVDSVGVSIGLPTR